jgi:hypothetical protein
MTEDIPAMGILGYCNKSPVTEGELRKPRKSFAGASYFRS